jgi:hypothetical protein
MEELLKRRIPNLYRLISIVKSTNGHTITYISLKFRYDKSPVFSIDSKELDITLEMRDNLISDLLNSKVENRELSLNEDLLTEQQIERIRSLRDNNNKSRRSSILESKIKWANQFKLGDPVFYKGEHGIISFKHQMKNSRSPQEWSVVCGKTEYRYVTGALLRPRNIEDLSFIPIDKELDKLDTERLLKMYKRSLKVNKGFGNKCIKRILYERENLNKVEKTINIR